MNDYYATLKIQQGRLKLAMGKMGIKKCIDLARRAKIKNNFVCDLLNFKISPKRKDGKWRVGTLKICDALWLSPDDLFPDYLQHEIPTNKISKFVDQVSLPRGTMIELGPGAKYEKEEVEQTIDEVLSPLTERERTILKSRFLDNKPIKKIGEEQGLSCQGVKEAEKRALKKLRYPAQLEKLEDIYAV